jgi:K+-sensing histidine kinase KdpD
MQRIELQYEYGGMHLSRGRLIAFIGNPSHFPTMNSNVNKLGLLPPKTADVIFRALRHEVGDLLQTIYATAAILNQRLPDGWELERQIVGDMKKRGETCKKLLDQTHDLVNPIVVTKERVSIADLLADTVGIFVQRYPHLQFHQEISTKAQLDGDAKWLGCLIALVLTHACECAGHEVWVCLTAEPGGMIVAFTVERDGPPPPQSGTDDLGGFIGPGQMGRSGLGLLLAQKIAQLHGGSLTALARKGGGVRFTAQMVGMAEKKGT